MSDNVIPFPTPEIELMMNLEVCGISLMSMVGTSLHFQDDQDSLHLIRDTLREVLDNVEDVLRNPPGQPSECEADVLCQSPVGCSCQECLGEAQDAHSGTGINDN